uniref:Amyloid beta (A4)-like protein 2 n=1 Tax=Rhipicephalus zambeziensis TaxID=60191 RepID=A0A224YCB0_9ACAR
MVMNTRAHKVILFFIVMHGIVLNSDGSEKFQFWKQYRDPVTRPTTTQRPLSTTADSNITAICNELEQAAEENDSWEDGLPEASGNESTEHHALAYRGN